MRTRAGGCGDGEETQDTAINEELDEPRKSKRARPEPTKDQQNTIDKLRSDIKKSKTALNKTQDALNSVEISFKSTSSNLSSYSTRFYTAQRTLRRRDTTIASLKHKINLLKEQNCSFREKLTSAEAESAVTRTHSTNYQMQVRTFLLQINKSQFDLEQAWSQLDGY